eukprot:1159183-Pelagomonas_calceolata.AAC.11
MAQPCCLLAQDLVAVVDALAGLDMGLLPVTAELPSRNVSGGSNSDTNRISSTSSKTKRGSMGHNSTARSEGGKGASTASSRADTSRPLLRLQHKLLALLQPKLKYLRLPQVRKGSAKAGHRLVHQTPKCLSQERKGSTMACHNGFCQRELKGLSWAVKGDRRLVTGGPAKGMGPCQRHVTGSSKACLSLSKARHKELKGFSKAVKCPPQEAQKACHRGGRGAQGLADA